MSNFCTHCGKENKDNSTFCRECGERLVRKTIVNSSNNGNSFRFNLSSLKSKIFNKKGISIIVVIFLICGGVGYFVYPIYVTDDIISNTSYDTIYSDLGYEVGDVSFSIPLNIKLNHSKNENGVYKSHFNLHDNKEYISIEVFENGFGEYEKYDKNTYTFPFEIDGVKGGLSVYSMGSEHIKELKGEIMCVDFYSDDEKIFFELSLDETDAEEYKRVLNSIKINY